MLQIIKEMPSSSIMNQVFVNNKGRGFNQMNNSWGVKETSNSNGAAYADLDNDGDLDLVVNNINQPVFIYRNESAASGKTHFLQFKLKGEGGNTMGLGAKLKLFHKGSMQLQEQNPARGYLSTVTYSLHFGLGNSIKADSVQIIWQTGDPQTVYEVKADQVITLAESDAKSVENISTHILPFFIEAPSPILHTDAYTAINDFNRQPLLIHGFSNVGPAMAKADLNGTERMTLS